MSPDLLCMLDFSGYFKQLNPVWERTLGFTQQELMARPFIEFVHPDDRERTLRQNAAVRSGGQAVAFENRYLCKDDSHRCFVWNAVPDAEERMVYSVARDITMERQAAVRVERIGPVVCVCSYCMKLRDEDESWRRVDHYLARHADVQLSHGICPTCLATELEPEIARLEGR